MLSPSDFNNAVPQFTNGDYASNPINPAYIAEPGAVDYNRGAEPLQTLPAQWWNWFLNKFTARFNKVNIYVKNIFNELTQLLSLVSETPSGTEATPTIGQLKDMFETKYPNYLALLMYPIGSIYWTGKAPNDGGDPNELFGGTWVQIKNCFIWAKGDNDALNATGGSKTVTLTEQQIPSHTHGLNNHTHSFTPSGTISVTTNPTFTGSTTYTGNSINTNNTSAKTSTGGMSANESHSHPLYVGKGGGSGDGGTKSFMTDNSNSTLGQMDSSRNYATSKNLAHTHNMEHRHSLTPNGSISGGAYSFSGTSGTTDQSSGNTTSTGGGQAHENMPPYIVKYCWERTA